jgi:hypothetical protein
LIHIEEDEVAGNTSVPGVGDQLTPLLVEINKPPEALTAYTF